MAELLINDPNLVGSALTLSAAITSTTATSMTTSGTITPSTGTVRAKIDNEIVQVTTPATSGTTYTIARGVGGTTPATHASGAVVHIVQAADELNAIMARIDQANTFAAQQHFQGGKIDYTPYKVRARGTQLQWYYSNYQKFTLDVVDYDPSQSWKASASQWIVPRTGYYRVIGSTNANSGNAAVGVVAYVVIWTAASGWTQSLKYYGSYSRSAFNSSAVQSEYRDILHLNYQDAVELWSFCTYGYGAQTFEQYDVNHDARLALHYLGE